MGWDWTRRDFLRTTAPAGSALVATGCLGMFQDGEEPTDTRDGGTTVTAGSDPTAQRQTERSTGTETAPAEPAVDLDGYPYGVGETRLDAAREVMAEAGYGPDDRFELQWLHYGGAGWMEIANTIRARLASAYVDLQVRETTVVDIVETGRKGTHEVVTLGWIMDYPRPQNFVHLIDPPNTVYDDERTSANGAFLFWSEDARVDPAITAFQTAQFDRIEANPEPTAAARTVHQDAAVKMEEGNWAAAGLIPVYHGFREVFWYDEVDYRLHGALGWGRAKSNRAVRGLDGSQTLELVSGTNTSLDPIGASRAGWMMDVCDAPMNFVNGTTVLQPLLVDSFEVSEDLRTYAFTLQEGIQFHDDWGELTADDVVYTIRRLVESEHSTNAYFPIEVLGIEHETETEITTDDDGEEHERERVVPGSTAVESTGKFTFTLDLVEPFAYVLEVLAHNAFSVIPEGIVGDIEGYDGALGYEEFATSNLVGTGPFEFEHWHPGEGGEFRLTTNEGYHGRPATFDGRRDTIVTEETARYNHALNENVDIFRIPTSRYDPDKVTVEERRSDGRLLGTYGPLENGKMVNYGGVPMPSTFWILFNMERVPQAVREAMAYVVNQDEFVRNVLKSRGEPAYHVQPPAIIRGGTVGYREHVRP